jgi:hypothetical protein
MFEDVDEFLDASCPIKANGKTYLVSEPTAIEGVRLQRLFAEPENTLTDEQEMFEIRKLLGPVWEAMNADGVGHTKAVFAGRCALIYYAISPSAAKQYASGGLDDPGNPLPPKPRWWRGSASAGTATGKVLGFARPGRMGHGTPAEDDG